MRQTILPRPPVRSKDRAAAPDLLSRLPDHDRQSKPWLCVICVYSISIYTQTQPLVGEGTPRACAGPCPEDYSSKSRRTTLCERLGDTGAVRAKTELGSQTRPFHRFAAEDIARREGHTNARASAGLFSCVCHKNILCCRRQLEKKGR